MLTRSSLMMSNRTQIRLLQAAVAILCLVPLSASLAGMLFGASAFDPAPPPTDVDSHLRYLSGIFFGVALGFLSCIPKIERKGARFRLLTAFVFLGGIGRLISLLALGQPAWPHMMGLGFELVLTPLLALWQWLLASRVS